MKLLSPTFNVFGRLSHLVCMLFTDGMHFLSLCARSRTALAAENLFLRKQLAFYQERKVRPRRFDNVTRYILVLLSYGFAWKEALVNVTPQTFIGWHRAGLRLFWRWKSRPGRPRIPRTCAPSFEPWPEIILAGARSASLMNSYSSLGSRYRPGRYESTYPIPREGNHVAINAGPRSWLITPR